jgi:Ribonuclease G/E
VSVSIRVAASPGEAHVAAVRGNRLLDYALWRPGSPDGVGDVHGGRVIAAVPAMAGAFVALADAEGFLPDSEGAKGLTAGTMLAVRITRAAHGNKGPRLTALVEQAGDGSVGLLRRGPNPVVRLASRYPDAAVLVDDPGVAAGLRGELGARVSVAEAVLDEDVAEAIDALSRPVVDLPGGARLSIWPTPALVAIDVDGAGALTGGRGRHEALNREVLPALAEQIRLRNLSGGIVVDLAGMAARKRAALAPDFVRALAEDPLRARFLGFTALGLAEIVRARVHPPLHELLSGPLTAGLAALRAVMGEYRRDLRGLAAVRAHPGVVSALQADSEALSDLARRTGRRVMLRAEPALAELAWTLETENG